MSRSRLESSRTSRSRLGWWSQRLGLELLRLVPIPVTATNFRSILFGHGASSTIYGTGAAAATRARLAVFEWLRRQPGPPVAQRKAMRVWRISVCSSSSSSSSSTIALAALRWPGRILRRALVTVGSWPYCWCSFGDRPASEFQHGVEYRVNRCSSILSDLCRNRLRSSLCDDTRDRSISGLATLWRSNK